MDNEDRQLIEQAAKGEWVDRAALLRALARFAAHQLQPSPPTKGSQGEPIPKKPADKKEPAV